jgi:molecular chaperone HscB
MADCWTCGAERGRAAFCPGCQCIQPVVPNTSLFEVLGLEPVMRLQRDVLERAFHELSRKVHPDRFGQHGSMERRLALEQTTVVNEAYRTLRRPRTRAEHLMALRGRTIGGEAARLEDPEFLMEMLELSEQLQDARAPAVIEPLRRDVAGRQRAHVEALERFFDDGEGDESAAVTRLEQLRFFERFLDEVDARLDGV